jgi:hypothetical protein
MVYDHGKNENHYASSDRISIDHKFQIDAKLVSDAIIELNIALKSVAIYPSGHDQVHLGLDRCQRVLSEILSIQPKFILGVARDTLMTGGSFLDLKNPVYKDFATSLSRYDISTVSFCRGLDTDDLFEFLSLLSRQPEDINACGGIEQVTSKKNILHIKICAVDYRAFRLTEEQEVSNSSPRKKPSKNIWKTFVTHLLSGTISTSAHGLSADDFSDMDPVELARILNEEKLDVHHAIDSYDKVISSYMRKTEEKKQFARQGVAGVAKLNQLLEELTPEMRQQFLSSKPFENSINSGLLNRQNACASSSGEFVISSLKRINDTGGQIAPALMTLIQALSGSQSLACSENINNDSSPIEEHPQITSDQVTFDDVNSLFVRQSKEEYVESDYGEVIDRLSEFKNADFVNDSAVLPAGDFLETLQDSSLDIQIIRAVIVLIGSNIGKEAYDFFVRNMVLMVDVLLDRGEFNILLDMFKEFTKAKDLKPLSQMRDLAEDGLKRFYETDFITRVVDAYDQDESSKTKDIFDFMLALGPDVIPDLIDIFCKRKNIDNNDNLLDLICCSGRIAVDEACRCLENQSNDALKNLLLIIERAGSIEDAIYIEPLVKSRDTQIRMDALDCLLKFKDPSAVFELRRALSSKKKYVVSQAIFLAGKYKVKVIIPVLVSMLKKIIFFKAGYRKVENIVVALGQIGDPIAIPLFETYARIRWSIFHKNLLHMKIVLFESLNLFPDEHINNLLNIGMKIENNRINSACRKLLRRQKNKST